MAQNRILVVDDDPLIRGSLYELLRGKRYEVEMASDGMEAINHLTRHSFDLVIADWKMPQVDGLNLLSHIKAQHANVSVVLITGFGTISSAVDAVRQGAFDYLTKPIQPEELQATIERALSQHTEDVPSLAEDPFAGIIGEDVSMQRVFAMVRAVASSPSTVLLEGESGTGKRVIAQAIHRSDIKRAHQPFVEISCGALSETLLESELFGHVRGAFTGAIRDKQGRFEIANGGTILLDEIDAFPPSLQVKLLRVIQDRRFEHVGDTRTLQVDVRIIAASNRNLAEWVRQGKFREDLYYRLNVFAIRLPPLRSRKLDLSELVKYFINRYAQALGKTIAGISEEAMALIQRYDWPGNVRELENVIERAVILARHARLEIEDFTEELRGNSLGCDQTLSDIQVSLEPIASQVSNTSLRDALKPSERDLIVKVLDEVRWNRSEAAKRLGIHRSTLYHKMRQLGIEGSLR